jgi:cytochrome d ubiquinol oxidase subunit I
MMVIAEMCWLRSRNIAYRGLARRWARGTAMLFAVGAVSGTVLSFELGLLWPRFMEWAGPVIGMPFSLEGFAFFTEAIFLGIYLYGWDRVSPRAHLASGILVAVSAAASALFVVIANGWMNTPVGLVLENGQPVSVDPIAAMLNPSAAPEAIHMLLAAYAASGFGVAGVHAFLLRRNHKSEFHRIALGIALATGGTAAVLQPFSGDYLARTVAQYQPVKLAAMEGQFKTERGAPLRIGGIPNEALGRTDYAIEIPRGLSLLAFHDPDAVVRGLEEFERNVWPPVLVVHVAFQIMVASGLFMMLVSLWALLRFVQKGSFFATSKRFLQAVIVASPLGFVAIEAGWTVTEVGRQPWIIQGILRTADAVTPMPGLIVPFAMFTLLYVFLAGSIVWLLVREFKDTDA